MPESLDAILDQIDQAGLSATAFRTAVRLLRLAQANEGQVRLSRGQATQVCGSDSDATMRTHLYQIAKAGIVEYNAAGDVFVKFLWWPVRAERANDEEIGATLRAERASEPEIEPSDDEMRAERASETSEMRAERASETSEMRAERASETSEMRAERANDDLLALGLRAERANLRAQRANGASTSHARSGRLGRYLSTTDQEKEKTYLPTSQVDGDGEGPPLEPMQQLALNLMEDSDVGVLHELAVALAREKPVQDIYRAVDRWLSDVEDGKVGPGVLKHRIKSITPSRKPTVKLSASFLSSDLFHRHRLPDELLADGRKRYNELPLDEPRKVYSKP